MKDETEALVSVIVPVYNVERQLSRCVKSILRQTYTHFELLLVNDGSKDASGSICDAYALKDNRIRVFHKENEGASSARNVGIEQSNGEYICFVDSDDYVDEEYLSAFFVDSLKKDKCTFVVQSLLYEVDGVAIKHPVFREHLYEGEALSALFYLNDIGRNGYTVCKLYNAELIRKNNIRFNNKIHYGEDLLLMMNYLALVKKVYLVDKSHYHYICTSGSLSQRYNSYESEILNYHLLNNAFKILAAHFHLNEQAKENFYQNNLGKQFLRSILTLYRPANKKTRKERLPLLKGLYTEENLIYFNKFAHADLRINKLGYSMYRRRLFRLFDFYYSLIYSLRYKMDKQWRKYLGMKLKGKIKYNRNEKKKNTRF